MRFESRALPVRTAAVEESPTFQHVRQLRHVKRSADGSHLLDADGGFDKECIGACVRIPLAAAECFIQPVNLARVRPRDNKRIGVDTIFRRRPDVRLHLFRIEQSFAGDMSAAFRGDLVLEEYGLGSEPFVEIDDVNDGLHVPIPVVAIDQHGQIAGRHDVANPRPDLSKPHQADVGNTEPRTDKRKSADEVGFETCALDEFRAYGVMRARKNQRTLACNKLPECCHQTCTPHLPRASLRVMISRPGELRGSSPDIRRSRSGRSPAVCREHGE